MYQRMKAEEYVADPRQLHAEAQKEPSRRGLDDYRDTIQVLRDEKGFSLREIAAWLQDRGLNVDHNAVWRTYSKGSQRGQLTAIPERIERNEQASSGEGAMPWL